MPDLPTAYPLEDLFDAAVRQRRVRLTCAKCRHVTVFDAVALWWLFERKGWQDRFKDVRKRCVCLLCLHERGLKIRYPELELVGDPPTETRLPLPSEIEWKRELRRRR